MPYIKYFNNKKMNHLRILSGYTAVQEQLSYDNN